MKAPSAVGGFLVAGALLFGQEAQAAPAWLDGTFAYPPTTASCPVTNTQVIPASSYVGYVQDSSPAYPQTGDIGYVHAVAANISGCLNDAIGLEFFLPEGASLAVSTTNSVHCYIGKLDGTSFGEVTNVQQQGLSCLQTPSAGSSGGMYFGFSQLAPGWFFEIRVPVLYKKQLLGLAGPNSHRLTVAAKSGYGTMWPDEPVTVFYRAGFQNLNSSAITSNTATLTFDLLSYFGSGQLYVDFGTTTGLGSSTPAASVPNSAASFPINVPMTGLSPGTTYFWRARFVTAGGTFTSATQSFTTMALPTVKLVVTLAGGGYGNVTSYPTGIDCGWTCSGDFTQGTLVTLTASGVFFSDFVGWGGGACSGTGPCIVTMDAAKSVTATFARQRLSPVFPQPPGFPRPLPPFSPSPYP